MPLVHVPRSLVALVPGLPRRLEVEGATVEAVLRDLEAHHPGGWDRVCTAGPRIREHINVFVDGRRADLATPTAPGSVVHVIPAVSGG